MDGLYYPMILKRIPSTDQQCSNWLFSPTSVTRANSNEYRTLLLFSITTTICTQVLIELMINSRFASNFVMSCPLFVWNRSPLSYGIFSLISLYSVTLIFPSAAGVDVYKVVKMTWPVGWEVNLLVRTIRSTFNRHRPGKLMLIMIYSLVFSFFPLKSIIFSWLSRQNLSLSLNVLIRLSLNCIPISGMMNSFPRDNLEKQQNAKFNGSSLNYTTFVDEWCGIISAMRMRTAAEWSTSISRNLCFGYSCG